MTNARFVGAVCVGFVLLTPILGLAKGGGSGGHHSSGQSRPSYGGGNHSESHGGTYKGGSGGSPHKGGHYVNPKTDDQYGKHE